MTDFLYRRRVRKETQRFGRHAESDMHSHLLNDFFTQVKQGFTLFKSRETIKVLKCSIQIDISPWHLGGRDASEVFRCTYDTDGVRLGARALEICF